MKDIFWVKISKTVRDFKTVSLGGGTVEGAHFDVCSQFAPRAQLQNYRIGFLLKIDILKTII